VKLHSATLDATTEVSAKLQTFATAPMPSDGMEAIVKFPSAKMLAKMVVSALVPTLATAKTLDLSDPLAQLMSMNAWLLVN
jgi:hypothetical protein